MAKQSYTAEEILGLLANAGTALDTLSGAVTPKKPAKATANGRLVIVRGEASGVVFGELIAHEGPVVHVGNAIQLWEWTAKSGGTLIDVAAVGVAETGNKFSANSARATVMDACAIYDVTPEAAESIMDARNAKWR